MSRKFLVPEEVLDMLSPDSREVVESFEVVECKLCQGLTELKTAHRHDDAYVGDECWDERLRATE